MDDRLLPRKVPEPTRFPSAIFEPCVPDASLVFGCGLFEAPTASAEVTKPRHETVSTENILQHSSRETAIPSWIKAYGVEKTTSVDSFNFQQSGRRCSSPEVSERRADVRVSERKSGENFSARTDPGLAGAGSTHVGHKTGFGNCEGDGVQRENLRPMPETAVTCEKLGKTAIDSFTARANTYEERYRYGLDGSRVTSRQPRSEFSDHSSEQLRGVAPVPRHPIADASGNSVYPARELPGSASVRRDGISSAAVPAPGERVEDVAGHSNTSSGEAARRSEVAHHVDCIATGAARDVASDASAPRLPRAVDFRKNGDIFPEPQRGFISSDCSLSDYTPLDSAKRRGKWKSKLPKESDGGAVSYETVGRSKRERDPTSKMRGSPRRAKRRDVADFGNAVALEEFGGGRALVSDPLIRALFHLQNRHTELLLQLAADVADVALKQRRMFDVFQRLQSAFCDSGGRAAAEAPSGGRGRRCDKCTQTDCGAERASRDAADAWTQSGRVGGAEGGRASEAGRPGGGEAATESGGPRKMPEDSGVAVRAAGEEPGRLVESASCVAERSEGKAVEARAGDEAPGGTVSPGDVRRLIGAVRSIAARVEDPGGKKRRPSREADEGRGEAGADVAGLIAAMRSAASRYKNNDVIKAPDLEDVAEATEDSSDSEDGEASEAGDDSLTLGDLSLSLVPQNVSLSPAPSLRIDPRGLEVSSDALASGSDGSDTEQSAHYPKGKGDCADNTDTTAVYLYRNIFSKVQEILDHSKTASESRRESTGKKRSTPEAENGRTRTRSH